MNETPSNYVTQISSSYYLLLITYNAQVVRRFTYLVSKIMPTVERGVCWINNVVD